MEENMIYYEMILRELAKKISNGSTAVTREDAMGNMLESLCKYVLVRREDQKTLLG